MGLKLQEGIAFIYGQNPKFPSGGWPARRTPHDVRHCLRPGAESWHKTVNETSAAPLLFDDALRARAQSFTRVAMSAPAAAPASAMTSISPYGGLCGEAAAGEAAAVTTAGAGAEAASTGLPPT